MMTNTDVIKMENGKKDLPVGISRNSGNKKGYRLHRSVGGKNYLFSSFQDLDHALRVNECIDVIVADLRAALEEKNTLSIDGIQSLIVENSVSDIAEISRLLRILDEQIQMESNFLIKQNARLHARLDTELSKKKTFWQRIMGR